MIPSNRNHLRAQGKLPEYVLNPNPFGLAGSRRVDNISQEYKTFGVQLIAHCEQFVASTSIHQRPEFTATPLCPTVPEMEICDDDRARSGNPKRSGCVRIQLRRDGDKLS